MAGVDNLEEQLGKQLLNITKVVENHVDEELSKLNDLNEMTQEKFTEEIEAIRANRLSALVKEALLRKEYLSKGHGTYDQLSNEKEFFNISKTSDNVIVHFFESGNTISKIIDVHMKRLCLLHLETRFIKAEIERCPFLNKSFNLTKSPVIIVVKNNRIQGRLIDFSQIKDIENYTTELLEWKLAKLDCINYSEDLNQPPSKSKPVKDKSKKSTIRESRYGDSSDSD